MYLLTRSRSHELVNVPRDDYQKQAILQLINVYWDVNISSCKVVEEFHVRMRQNTEKDDRPVSIPSMNRDTKYFGQIRLHPVGIST
jgi:hypothetical protein